MIKEGEKIENYYNKKWQEVDKKRNDMLLQKDLEKISIPKIIWRCDPDKYVEG